MDKAEITRYPTGLIEKAATDAGYDLGLGESDGWLNFGISGGSSFCAAVKANATGLWLAVSSRRILPELTGGGRPVPSPATPAGLAGPVFCPDFDNLLETLRRARILDATLPERLYERWRARIDDLPSTERTQFVTQRVGQDLFREGLMDYWDGRCAITGLDVPELLRASHAKPWKDATDEERLDIHNGLLLAVHLDALFDQGFITILEDGAVEISTTLLEEAIQTLGLPEELTVQRLRPEHEPYLKWHREHVFRG